MKGSYVLKALLAVTVVVALVASSAAQIKVNVNGSPVSFPTTGPQKIGGRVLVPLRGVMEKIGAFVGWDAATRTVTAQKGDIDLSMRLGERTAVVNGRTVTLDVPAQSINGVTMVPLRFMGETLGAEVLWDAATETININLAGGGNTGGGGGNTGGGGGGGNVDVSISGFNHDGSGWIRKGQSVTFTLTGTPKATATATISGVSGTINLVEESAGRYVGRWTPTENLNLEGTSVIGSLKIGTSERLIQSGATLSVDTQAPTLRAFSPDQGSTIALSRPSISGVFEDAGSGIDASAVTIKVNGQNVTTNATVNANLFLYEPKTNLPNGMTNVEIAFRDRAGNVGMFQASFMVAATGNASVKSFLHTATIFAQVGKAIGFKIEAEPGAKITVSLGTIIKGIALKETAPGVYTGAYMVKQNDRFNNSPVTAQITLASGQSFTVEAPRRIPKTMDAGQAFGPATITSHQNGGAAQNPLVVSGRALPKAKVQIRVTYATTVLGALRVTGVLSDQTVDVDANGNWTSQAINLSSAVKGENTEYTVTATSVQSDGTKASPTTIKLK